MCLLSIPKNKHRPCRRCCFTSRAPKRGIQPSNHARQNYSYFSLKHHQKQADYHHFDTVFKTYKKGT